MARAKSSAADGPQKPTMLSHSRAEVAAKLAERISLGKEIQASEVRSEANLEDLRSKRTKWNSFNVDLLKSFFDPDAVAKEYDSVSICSAFFAPAPSLMQEIKSFQSGMQNKITSLESIVERLDLFQETRAESARAVITGSAERPKAVFVVHGTNETVKINVTRFIEQLGVSAVILHEQPNKGRTIIEKFEHNAANVGFAVVLLTADDVGALNRPGIRGGCLV